MSRIVCIGSGHVATRLAVAFRQQGHKVIQVYSPTRVHAVQLADSIGAKAINDLTAIDQDADFYLIAVSDQAIPQVIAGLPADLTGIIVHTSGTSSIDLLSKFERYGVIYPPQSLRKEIETDLSQVPFALEGNSTASLRAIADLMAGIAPKAFACNSEQRLALHVAAIFANNFSNALFQIAYQTLRDNNLDFELLRPIIMETAMKVQQHLPSEVQTGPAQRGDTATIKKHLQFLSDNDERSQIYQSLTDFISKSRPK